MRLYKPLWTDEQVKKYLEPYTKMEGVYLEFKVEISESLRSIIVEVDIASSFENNDGARIKNFLRNNNFISLGNGAFTRNKVGGLKV